MRIKPKLPDVRRWAARKLRNYIEGERFQKLQFKTKTANITSQAYRQFERRAKTWAFGLGLATSLIYGIATAPPAPIYVNPMTEQERAQDPERYAFLELLEEKAAAIQPLYNITTIIREIPHEQIDSARIHVGLQTKKHTSMDEGGCKQVSLWYAQQYVGTANNFNGAYLSALEDVKAITEDSLRTLFEIKSQGPIDMNRPFARGTVGVRFVDPIDRLYGYAKDAEVAGNPEDKNSMIYGYHMQAVRTTAVAAYRQQYIQDLQTIRNTLPDKYSALGNKIYARIGPERHAQKATQRTACEMPPQPILTDEDDIAKYGKELQEYRLPVTPEEIELGIREYEQQITELLPAPAIDVGEFR